MARASEQNNQVVTRNVALVILDEITPWSQKNEAWNFHRLAQQT